MRLSQHFAAWLSAKPISVRIALILALICGPALYASADDTIVVTADQARIVKIPAGAQTLVIGNPFIADVTLQNGVMIVTGKGFGETNFIAMDGAGNPVAESMIRVVGASNALVVQRGLEQQSYTCAPRCQPTVKLGDDPKYMSDVANSFQSHSAQASGK